MLTFLKNIGPTEIALIALIFIVLFGAKALISLARTSGQTFKEIKKIKKSFTEALEEEEPEKKEVGS